MNDKYRAAGLRVLAAGLGLTVSGMGHDIGAALAQTAAPAATPVAADRLGSYDSALAEAIGGDSALRAVYAARGGAPIWTSAADAGRRAAFFAALDSASVQALPGAGYDAAGLRAAFGTIRSERERGLLEAKMSRTFLDYAQDVSSGILDPAKIDPTIVRDLHRPDRQSLLAGFARAQDPDGYLHALAPQAPEYAQLLRARFDLGQQIAAGGWGAPVPGTATLHPGDSGPAIVALRHRMRAMGYYPGHDSGAKYDEPLRQAVRAFQIDLGEIPDGIVGKTTLAEINTPPEQRLKSVVVAMERLRWINHTPLGERYIWVNIPDFHARIFDNGEQVFDTTTVVGQADPDRRTPEFSDRMQFLVINPSWHIPRSITVKEYLPKMQRDPYAAAQIQIVDKQGNVMSRDAIDFGAYTADTFPYRMRQDPSEDNALGAVKFLFPNKWNIYLHDTPSKSLFNRPVRAFSHGCIRIGQPFDLAYQLLAPQTDDPVGFFQSILETGQEKTLKLADPIPVHLVYFTAWPSARGRIQYRDDIYGRDAALYDALAQAGVELLPPTN